MHLYHMSIKIANCREESGTHTTSSVNSLVVIFLNICSELQLACLTNSVHLQDVPLKSLFTAQEGPTLTALHHLASTKPMFLNHVFL